MPIAFNEDDFADTKTNVLPQPFSEDDFAQQSLASVLSSSPLIRIPRPVSTTAGGPRISLAGPSVLDELSDPETRHDLASDLSRPAVPIPKLNINPDDSKTVAAGKEAVNIVASIPEFFESPIGVGTAGIGGVGGAVSRIVTGLFAADSLHSVGRQILETHRDWDTMTPSQKAAAVTDIAGTGAFAGLLTHGTVNGHIPSIRTAKGVPLSDIPEEQPNLTLKGVKSQEMSTVVDKDVSPPETEEDLQHQLGEAMPKGEEPATKSDLEDEHLAMLDEAAKKHGADVAITTPEEIPSDEPFASGVQHALRNAIATIDRRSNRVLINPVELKRWLDNVPEAQHKEAINSLISEEKIHLGVDDNSAEEYWKTLTGPEQAIAKARYSPRLDNGKLDWKGERFGPDMNDALWGHEALRFRLQQLSRMSPREIAEASGKDRWTLRSITALESVIRGLRNTFGKGDTKAIVDRMASNLNIAKVAAGASQPRAMRRDQNDEVGGIPAPPPGERLITVERPDGTTYQASFSDKYYDHPSRGKVASIAKLVNGQWSHGMLADGEKIVDPIEKEIEALNESAAQYERSGDKASAEEIRNMAKSLKRKGGESFFPAARSRFQPVRELTEEEKAALAALPRATPEDEQRYQKQLESFKELKPSGELFKAGEVYSKGKVSKSGRGEYSKDRAELSAQGKFFLPPPVDVPGESLPPEERSLPEGQQFMPSLTGKDLEGKAAAWLKSEMDKVAEAGKKGSTVALPRYSDFEKRIRAATGGKMQRGAMFDTWQRLVTDELQKASGDTLTAMYRSELGKRVRKSGGVPVRSIAPVADAIPAEQMIVQKGIPGIGANEVLKPRVAGRAGVRRPSSEQEIKGQPSLGLEWKQQPIERAPAEVVAKEKVKVSEEIKTLEDKAKTSTLTHDQSHKLRHLKWVLRNIHRAAVLAEKSGKAPLREAPEATVKFQDESLIKSRQARRQKVIGYLFERIIKRPIEDIKHSLARTSITPEDIRIGGANRYEGDHTSSFQAFGPEAERNPSKLGEMLTDESGVSGDLPESVTRRVTVLQNRRGEDVHMVSTYDDNGVARLLDPASGSAKMHSPLGSILRRYRVLYSVLLDEPVQKFNQRYESPGEFMDKFGNEAMQRQESAMSYEAPSTGKFLADTEGSRGIEGEGGSFQGPERDIVTSTGEGAIDEARRTAMTPDEARSLFDLAISKQESGKLTSEEVVDAIMSLRETPNRKATAALVKMSESIQKRFPDASPQELIKATAESILRAHELSKNMGEFTELMGAVTEPSMAEESRSEEGGIEIPYTVAEAKAIRSRYQLKKRIGLIGPEDYGIKSPAAKSRFRIEMEAKDSAMDEIEKRRRQLGSSWIRKATRMTIRQNADGMDNDSTMAGERVRKAMQLVSGDEKIRSTPMIMIASGKMGKNVKTGRPFFFFDKATAEAKLKEAELGIAKAQEFLKSNHANDRRIGRAWLKAATQLEQSAQLVLKHWGDGSDTWKEIKRMAFAVKSELQKQVETENASGIGTTFRENYYPGRYDSEFFNDDSISFGENRTLGRRFSARKRFTDAYEAIARGPYIPKSYDAADIVGHRVRQGMQAVNRPAWGEMLKNLVDPQSKKPVAVAAVPKNPRQLIDPDTGEKVFSSGGWEPPSADYELMTIRQGADPIAVLSPYKSVVSACMAESGIENWPTGRAALMASRALKHGVVLLFDTFHPMRLGQYAMSLTPGGKGYRGLPSKGGYSALLYRAEDIPEAVAKGKVTKEAAAWALGKIEVNYNGIKKTATRQQLLESMVKKGLNAAKIADALQRDAVESIPIIGKTLYHRFKLGKFNDAVFGHFLPGLISESAVRNFEKFNKRSPDVNFDRMMRDVITDMNAYYGNMGRQGVFLNPTWRDAAQIFLLAPMWQEGLLQKEMRFYSRLSGLSSVTGRKGLPKLGALGEGMATGLAAYFVLTQLINLATRGQMTFNNKEKGHQLDAFLPVGNEGQGFWLSPMSVFAESTHDILRLAHTKDTVWQAMQQFTENKLGPVGKMAYTLETGKSSSGDYLTSTPSVIMAAAGELAPVPISLGKPIKAAGHALFPGQVGPNPPGALTRQLVSTLGGVKLENAQLPQQQIQAMATKFVQASGKKAASPIIGFTDQPSYAQMRHAIDIGDEAGAQKILKSLEGSHSEYQIIDAMNKWARRPFTGGIETEQEFVASLSDEDRDLYTKANVQRMQLLSKWTNWYTKQQGQ